MELSVGGRPLLLSCSTNTFPSLIGTEVVTFRRQLVRQPLVAWAIPMSGGPAPISGAMNIEAKSMVIIAIGALALTVDFPGLIRGIEVLSLEAREPEATSSRYQRA